MRAAPKLVSLLAVGVAYPRRGLEHVQDPNTGIWYYRAKEKTMDQKLVAAYTEAMGHAPRNLDPLHPGYAQWTYNPRKKNSKPLAEVAGYRELAA